MAGGGVDASEAFPETGGAETGDRLSGVAMTTGETMRFGSSHGWKKKKRGICRRRKGESMIGEEREVGDRMSRENQSTVRSGTVLWEKRRSEVRSGDGNCREGNP